MKSLQGFLDSKRMDKDAIWLRGSHNARLRVTCKPKELPIVQEAYKKILSEEDYEKIEWKLE